MGGRPHAAGSRYSADQRRPFSGNPMSGQPGHDFSSTHYASLSELEQAILRELAKHLSGEDLDPAADASLHSTFNILRPCDGCLPDEEIGDDLLSDIRRKFACVYYTAIERAENQLKAR